MTQDEISPQDIIEMARQAGANVHFSKHHIKFLEAFAKLVALRYEKKIADLENIISQRHWDVLQEREACAMVCWWIAAEFDNDSTTATRCTDAIRARSSATSRGEAA